MVSYGLSAQPTIIMDNAHMKDLIVQLGPLVANVLLVGITAWYAHLTRQLVKSSERSSTLARESAQQARRAAEAAEAALVLTATTATQNLEFNCYPYTWRSDGYAEPAGRDRHRLAGFLLSSPMTDAFIHSVTCESVAGETRTGRWWGGPFTVTFFEDLDLNSRPLELRSPHFLEQGDGLFIKLEGGTNRELIADHAKFTIHFSLDGRNQRRRTVTYARAVPPRTLRVKWAIVAWSQRNRLLRPYRGSASPRGDRPVY